MNSSSAGLVIVSAHMAASTPTMGSAGTRIEGRGGIPLEGLLHGGPGVGGQAEPVAELGLAGVGRCFRVRAVEVEVRRRREQDLGTSVDGGVEFGLHLREVHSQEGEDVRGDRGGVAGSRSRWRRALGIEEGLEGGIEGHPVLHDLVAAFTTSGRVLPADGGLAQGSYDGQRSPDEALVGSVVHPERLVPADMEEWSGRHRSHRAQHVRHEALDPGVVGIELIGGHPGDHFGSGQLGVGPEGSGAMTRYVDLGHDGDEPARGVLDDLGVIGPRVVPTGSVPERPLPADLGEQRESRDLDPPTLVVREVQVQDVGLVEAQDVDDPLHLGHVEEATGHVEGESPPGVPRSVDHGDRVLRWCRQQLAQRGEAAEHPLRRRGVDHDPVGLHP